MKMQDKKQQILLQKNHNLDNNISKTGYRALFLLLKLIESPMTRDEILEEFRGDLIIKNDLSKDSVTNTINTLRKSGCIISRPSQRTSNSYVLKSHPFFAEITQENADVLQELRESIVSLGDWQLLFALNDLYAKLAQLTNDEEIKNKLLYEHPFKNINCRIVKELMVSAKIKKQANICYLSPENGLEDLYIVPEFLSLENRKLYVWGFCPKYNEFSYFRVDRIRKVNLVNFLGDEPETQPRKKKMVLVEYKLKDYSALTYLSNEDEIIVSESTKGEYPLKIRAYVTNKFNFFQRILYYGADCKLISPSSIKEEFLSYVKDIKGRYQND